MWVARWCSCQYVGTFDRTFIDREIGGSVVGVRNGIFQLKIFRVPLFSRGEYSHSLIIFRRIFLISKFSAPNIAFLAF